MILVFGGTTEGRLAAEELEDAGKPFYYSTKMGEQEVNLHHGIALSGVMPRTAMVAFCKENAIRLLVDAAHPFANHLHHTIASVSEELNLPAVRYERLYPTHYDPRIVWCESYEDMIAKIKHYGKSLTILSTMGVQAIATLNVLKTEGYTIRHRILNRQSSIDLAYQQNATDDELYFYSSDTKTLLGPTAPDILLVKDSGLSGGFEEKVKRAFDCNVKVLALKRPETLAIFHTVNGPHGLRLTVEKLLPEFYPLHSGLTTGTYATAASVAAATQLLTNTKPSAVGVILPDGETVSVPVFYAEDYAYAIKESGDDPDVTNGLEIRSKVEFNNDNQGITIAGGQGVGTITVPGFDSPPGEAAINKVPRQMIRENILRQLASAQNLKVTISIPRGEEVASRTFNPRLGIVGGISIVGVSGIIKPFSDDSFLSSIHKCLEVAKASGSERVVINSGAKSEQFVRTIYPDLPQQAFVEYGNFIGDTIRMAAEVGFKRVTLGVMLGKAVKLAAGNLDTHSRHTVMDKRFIIQMLTKAGCTTETTDKAKDITLARELWHIVPQDDLSSFAHEVVRNCQHHCNGLLPNGELTVYLIDEQGKLYT